MNIKSGKPGAILAQRRLDLIARCDAQRGEFAEARQALMQPFAGGALRQAFGGSLKIPLIVGGVALGLLVTRPSRAMSLLQSGIAMWGTVGSVMAMVRKARVSDVT